MPSSLRSVQRILYDPALSLASFRGSGVHADHESSGEPRSRRGALNSRRALAYARVCGRRYRSCRAVGRTGRAGSRTEYFLRADLAAGRFESCARLSRCENAACLGRPCEKTVAWADARMDSLASIEITAARAGRLAALCAAQDSAA